MPETSVIIRTYNEQKRLPALFDALAAQTYHDFETIVVDSGSFDRTREIAERRADRLIRISSHDFTYGFSLNTGIRVASGRFVVIVSAHTVPVDAHWIERLIAPLADQRAAMTYGRHLGVACSKFSEVEDFERLFGPTPREEHPSRFAANNANAALKRALWEQHPFDETLPGLEDVEWARHWMGRGFRVRYVPEAALYHIHEESWRQIRNRYYREAVAWRRMSIKGRRHIPRELARECAALLADLGRAFAPDGNPVCERLTLGQRLREIVYYRLNRNLGMVQGFLEAHPMETRAQSERIYFNKPAEALVIHGPGRATLEPVELPPVKPGDLKVRIAHVAVCATDLEILDGTLGYFHNGLGKYPIVPGHEFAGEVVEVGRNASGFSEGDRVVVECIQGCGTCRECRADNAIGCAERSEVGVLRRNGAYGEYLVTPARFAHKVPAGLDLRRAALTEPLAVVLKGLRRLAPALAARGAPPPHRCLVVGAGPIGHLVAKVLAGRGYAVTAFDRNPARRALFAGTGVAVTDDLGPALAGHDVVVEATGNPEVLERALHESPANAALLLLGLPYGARAFSFETIAAYDKTVIGSVGSTAADFEAALALLGHLDLEPYLRCAMPLREFRAAWETARHGDVLKVILDVNPQVSGEGGAPRR